jgi:hypothetical protein
MEMRRTLGIAGFVAVSTLFAAVAAAQEKAPEAPPPASPDEVTTGEVRIQLSSDYAKLLVDGEPWEESAYENNGMLLIVHMLGRTADHKLALAPIYPDLAPVELAVSPSDWKLASIGKKEKVWRVERKVAFPKAKAGAKPAPKAEPEPAPGE